ncbi:very short patch repair endonuclease [Streptomyces sp. NBC_01762]|uniref:very short patch repair endonuclease n=1 Tax=Streptomyces sp. NBC_01762 TaxID=2975933 RepID=UPI002DDB45C1|nr:very short patch repair endonuclease [Streptomyces sp. NBC_01762]WSC45322.1 very short patch repair endonuclease [Streptomyces sp. NBC_01762]
MSTAKPSSPGVSARMSRQARRDTTPEVAVRKLLHAAGYRYRINERVPGMSRRTIDIAFTRAKVAVMIDGCFWHGCPEHATQPKANSEWWRVKLDRNMARDVETTEHLTAAGWTVLRFWEHEAPSRVADRVAETVDRERSVQRTPHFDKDLGRHRTVR